MAQGDDGQCTCIGELYQLTLADDYAENVAQEFVEHFGGTCPAMMDFVVERIIARLIHICVMNHDRDIVPFERKVLDAVQKHIQRLSNTTPAVLKIIMDEAAMKEKEPNARH